MQPLLNGMNAERKLVCAMLAALAASVGACAAQPAQLPVGESLTQSILASSSPTAGSTVPAPVDSIALHFNPPARLDELTITGPEGTMPTMVHSVGEVADYSIPVSGLEAGRYRADWKAFIGTREYRGSFEFTVQ